MQAVHHARPRRARRLSHRGEHQQLDLVAIKGKGGGQEGPRTPVEAPNTLHSRTTARVMFLVSQGETVGLTDQTSKMKSVYFNNSPVQNADGSVNYAKTSVEERYGLPSQTVMAGYPAAANTYTLGQKITTSSPISYTTVTGAVDAVRVTIRFPALFAQNGDGDTVGTPIAFEIQTKLGAGVFTTYQTVNIDDKCSVPVDLDYLVTRPGTTGVWTVKVIRLTADNVSSSKANDIYFQFATEIQDTSLSYPNRALLGVTTSAETTGSTYPTVAFDYMGLKVKIPSNYTVATRTYAGVWDGTFKATKEWTDNPAWVVYDLLTNAEYGMGSIISASDIDQYSFYDAAVYCDGLVPALVGGVVSGTEPRFTFNYQFMEQQDAWALIQNTAASFGGVVYTSGNKVRLVQDRPTSASRLITNSNVIDGLFEYVSTQEKARTTSSVVYWNNPAENFRSIPAYYEDAAGIARYGYNHKQMTGLGVTTEGQAMRLAKWVVDTGINNTEAVSFKVGFSNAGLEPGEVVKIMDTFYAGVSQEAKVVSKVAGSITLDRPIAVVSGNTFDTVGSDGVTLETRTITSTGTLSTINYSGAAVTAPSFADVIVTGAISPRTFKIINVKEDSHGVYAVSAVQYDANKFARVDNTPVGVTPVYQTPANFATVGPVTGINFAEESYNDANGSPKRRLVVKWTPPANQLVSSYILFWSKDKGPQTDAGTIYQPYTTIPIDASGTYSVMVYAVNAAMVRSPVATAATTVDLVTPSGASSLSAVSGLQVKTVGGTTFSGTALAAVWSDPNVVGPGGVVDCYEVQVKDAATPTTVYRIENVQTPEYVYDLTKQQQDNGANLKRSVILSVRIRDTWGRFTTATAATFGNPTPPTVSGATATASFKGAYLQWPASTDPDVAGYLVWRGASAAFTPSSGNLIFDGNAISFSDSGLNDSATYYYKFAAYDSFGKSYAGTDLNVSAASAVATLANNFTNEYQLTGVTWTPNSPGANQLAWSACTAVKTLGASAGTTWAVTAGSATWTSGILYIYYVEGNATLSSTTTLATAIGDTKIIVATYRGGTNLEHGDGRAYQDGSFLIAGTVGASQLVTGTAVITQGAQIASAVVGTAHIVDGNITSAKIADANITTAKIADANITGAKIANATITAANIMDATITTAKIGTAQIDTLQIAGNAVTAPGSANGTASGVSISMTCIAGQPVYMTGVADGGSYAGGGSWRYGYLQVDGTTVKTTTATNVPIIYVGNYDALVVTTYAYTPATTGSYTFNFYASGGNTGATIYCVQTKR